LTSGASIIAFSSLGAPLGLVIGRNFSISFIIAREHVPKGLKPQDRMTNPDNSFGFWQVFGEFIHIVNICGALCSS
jgi:hypothetical protein